MAQRNRFTSIAIALSTVLLVALSVRSAALGAASAAGNFPEGADIHRVLVIPVNIRGRTPVAIDRGQIVEALYGARESVASRYRRISYGRVEFAGSAADVVDPIIVDEPADFCGKGLGALADAALDAVRRRRILVDAYNHDVFVLPRDTPCWWTGLGDIGGKRVWAKATTAKALEHELGHNLGMDHAVRWRGPDADPSDFMGSGSASLNAPHVVEMRWLEQFPGKVITVHNAEDLTLEALETDPRKSEVAKIAIVRPRKNANTYYLSYRAADATNPLPDDITKGLNIHAFDVGDRHTYLVATLSDGATYEDGALIVTQLAHVAGERVAVRIRFTGTGVPLAMGRPLPEGAVESLGTGKCLDLAHGAVAEGTPVIQYDCHGGANQQWTFEASENGQYRIISRLSRKCVGIDEASAAPGSAIVHTSCRASLGQRWSLRATEGGFVVQNAGNGLCLDVPGASANNNVQPITWTCNGGTNQTWRFAR